MVNERTIPCFMGTYVRWIFFIINMLAYYITRDSGTYTGHNYQAEYSTSYLDLLGRALNCQNTAPAYQGNYLENQVKRLNE